MSPRFDLPLSVLAWLAGFLLLGRTGSWLPLAVLAIGCAARLVIGDPRTRRLLTPGLRTTALGLLGAVVMLVGTYVLYRPLCMLFPALPIATAHLYALLRMGAPSMWSATLLIVVVSASEEIIWRGRVVSSEDLGGVLAWPTRQQGLRVLVASLIYGLAHIASGSLTLVVVAFVCGLAWGLLRIATRSLWAPIITHVLWDLVVVFVWPLA